MQITFKSKLLPSKFIERTPVNKINVTELILYLIPQLYISPALGKRPRPILPSKLASLSLQITYVCARTFMLSQCLAANLRLSKRMWLLVAFRVVANPVSYL